MTRAGLSILAALLLIAPMAAWLAGREPSAVADAARFVLPGDCRPEPGERAAFLACAVGLPTIVFGAAWVVRRVKGPAWLDNATGLVLLALAATVAVAGVVRDQYDYLLMNGFARAPVWSVPMLAAALALVWCGRRGGKVLALGVSIVAGLTVAAMALARVFGPSAPDAYLSHFEPLYHPTIQVALGKTILVDAASQYGLYPHLLGPIVRAFGFGVLPFTIAMAVLVAGVLAMEWSFLASATENRGVAITGFLAMVASGSYILFHPRLHESYFQYMPVRVVFPAASVWLAWRYLRRPSRRRYAVTMAFLGAGPLWNLDAGLPALAAWVGMLGYLELANRDRRPPLKLARLGGHGAAGALAVAVWFLGYAVFALVRSGRLPDFAGFAAYQAMFYTSGFFMLPMPWLGAWCLVAMVYLAALVCSAGALAEGRATPRSAIAFHLAMLGIGLFSYYQGRSYPTALTFTWWPAALLLTLFLDALVSERGRALPRGSRLAWAAVLVAVLAGPAWSLAWAPGFLRGWYAEHLLAARGAPRMQAEVAMLKENVRPGERVLIVSRHESILNAALRMPSAWRSSLVEALLVDDFRALAARVEAGEFAWLYLDDSALAIQFRANLGLPELGRVFHRGTVVASTPHARLIRANRGAPSLLGPPPPGVRLHVRFEDGRPELRLAQPPLAPGPRFTVEALVRPEGPQAERATIIGNLPGAAPGYASGFALQQAGPDGNAYALFTGDGRAFHSLAEFRVEPGRWTYVAVAVGGGTSATYLDGRLVAARPIPDPLPLAPSPLPVVVGDYMSRDRPFKGAIAEVRVSDGLVTPDEVARRATSASRGLEAIAGREGGAVR